MRAYAVLLTLSIFALGTAAGKAAAVGPLPSDPSPDSPAGTIYELPLDTARGVAAPSSGLAADGGAGGAGIRSENHFSSSSEVPGVAGDEVAGAAPGPEGGGADGDAGGGDAGSRGAGTEASQAAVLAAGDGGPSIGLAFALLAAIALVGAGVGVTAARAGRSRDA